MIKTELYAINTCNSLLERFHRDKMHLLHTTGRHCSMQIFLTTEEMDFLEQFARIGIGEVIKDRARREIVP